MYKNTVIPLCNVFLDKSVVQFELQIYGFNVETNIKIFHNVTLCRALIYEPFTSVCSIFRIYFFDVTRTITCYGMKRESAELDQT